MFVRKDGLGKVEGWLTIPLVVWLTRMRVMHSNYPNWKTESSNPYPSCQTYDKTPNPSSSISPLLSILLPILLDKQSVSSYLFLYHLISKFWKKFRSFSIGTAPSSYQVFFFLFDSLQVNSDHPSNVIYTTLSLSTVKFFHEWT